MDNNKKLNRLNGLSELKGNIFVPEEPKTFMQFYGDECVDLVLTAPPDYIQNSCRHYEELTTRYSWEDFDSYMRDMENVFTEAYRMLKSFRYCVVVTGDQKKYVNDGHLHEITFPLAAYFTIMLEKIGFTYITECVWDKCLNKYPYQGVADHYPMSVMPKNCCDHILIFQKRENKTAPPLCPYCGKAEHIKIYGFNRRGERKWICCDPECSGRTENTKRGVFFLESGTIKKALEKEENIIPKKLLEKWHRNIVAAEPVYSDPYFKEARRRYIPRDIAELAISFFSGVGDHVLDPFCGLETVPITAVDLKRKYLCFEDDFFSRRDFRDYVDMLKRCSEIGNEFDNADFKIRFD